MKIIQLRKHEPPINNQQQIANGATGGVVDGTTGNANQLIIGGGGVPVGIGVGPAVAALNAGGSGATAANKKLQTPTPYRYCMPTHALYTAPVPTARKILLYYFYI